MKRRVVVTGLGLVSPLGVGVEQSWQALCQGKSGVARITLFDPSPLRTQIGGEVKNFAPENFMEKKVARRMDRFIQFAVAAASMAAEDARLKPEQLPAERVGVMIGTGLAGLATYERNHELALKGAFDQISPFFVLGFIANMAATQVAIRLSAKGPCGCPVTACAAGVHALGDSYRIIQRGEADIMVAGASEAPFTPLFCAGMEALRVTTPANQEPQKAIKPFDKNRDGFANAEGSGIVVLEELETALRRGARIYAEVIGYGINHDAYHLSSPSPSGEGAASCIKMALREASISPAEVDYINAHGTATLLNDLSETAAIKIVFGEHSAKIPISSNKSMIGHCLGAAGAVESVFTILSIRDGVLPATINYETPDPQCDLDYVPNQARRAHVRTALCNSFGFGGHNGVLIFRELTQ